MGQYIHTYKKIPILVDFIKKRVHFIKNSDVINFVIDQSQPGVFYLKKMMNFMKPIVFYLKKMMNFMKPEVFYLQKMMNFMKMRTFYKKLPLFIKKLNFAYLKKNQTSNMSFYKKTPFLELLETPAH